MNKKVINTEDYKVLIKESDEGGKGSTDNKDKSNKKYDTSEQAGKKIVNYALNFVGNPYVWGGSSLTNGCDCSHFVYLILKDVGAYKGSYTISSNWINLGKEVKGGLKNAQAGDIVVYSGHVGIYDGKQYLVEAKDKAHGITHDRRPENSSRKLLGVRRFV